jgi:hypothetical protein
MPEKATNVRAKLRTEFAIAEGRDEDLYGVNICLPREWDTIRQ